MSILQISSSISTHTQSLSSTASISGCPYPARTLFLAIKFPEISFKISPIRMGGGPRTFPGGVSKWQWKRMQAKKSKQLLQARLARERQIYEMRKRAELKAAVSELERPWEAVEKAPTLFSASADEQLKVLADRFQKPGGFDLWSDNDGPELFRPDNGVPSERFFPKGVVHSTKPYGKNEGNSNLLGEFKSLKLGENSVLGRKMYNGNSKRTLRSGLDDKGANVNDLVSRNSDENVHKGSFDRRELGFDRRDSERFDRKGEFGSLSLGEDSVMRRNDERTSVGRKSYNGNSNRTLHSGLDEGMKVNDFRSRNLERFGKDGESEINVQMGKFEKRGIGYSGNSDGINNGREVQFDRKTNGVGKFGRRQDNVKLQDSVQFDRKGDGVEGYRRRRENVKRRDSNSEVYDMSAHKDGRYRFESENEAYNK